ncbi:hypothetical protein HD_1897 [[Haemophilus] ducreyi 35000HP]|uniref:Uncharacterized protein n=1 Tax=Haemophilus ducreyi (strain 35000HP / ATCC 700724) TaxID=233412 RepID=Q7VKK1_HAEDU|nr:hypothetical protein HD_1897 [[Haemophilus] ducreyi 35000HP]
MQNFVQNRPLFIAILLQVLYNNLPFNLPLKVGFFIY